MADPKQTRGVFAYLGVFHGIVQSIQTDLGDASTAEFVSDVVTGGGHVERVPIEVARRILFEEWPEKEVASGQR